MKAKGTMDADLAARFISTLTKSLQAVLHGCLDCTKDIELGGYVFLRIDSTQRVDYVLNEKMEKNDVNSMTFHSNSFHALPQPGSSSAATLKPHDKNPSGSSSDSPDKQSRTAVESNRAHSRSQENFAGSVSSAGRRHSDGFAQPDSSALPSGRGRDQAHPLSIFQAAFRAAPHGMGSSRDKPSSSAVPQAMSLNGSGSVGRQMSPSHSQPVKPGAGILPDASEMEVVHIKTEDDDVFNIPFSCQQAGANAGENLRRDKCFGC
jgi:hypothetical protein